MSEKQFAEYDESRRRFLRNAALVGVSVAAAPLLLPPAPAEAGGLFSMPSPGDQKKIGDQATKDILKKYKEVFDGRATHFNGIGQRLVTALPDQDRNTWDFRFHVLDSKEVNAFALPGGNMFMFTGLYEKLATDDGLAAVTGHEMTHVRLQHWAKASTQAQKVGILENLALIFLKAGRTAQTLTQMADSAYNLRFSRGDEDQADAGGLDNMIAAGYNPQGMIQLFETLQKVSRDGALFGSDFMSDHPLTKDRIKHAQARIAQYQRSEQFPPLTPLDYKSLY